MNAAAHAAPVQTSAQPPEPDLFPEDQPAPARATAILDVPCRLLADAQVQVEPVGPDLHLAPVLHLHGESRSGLGHVLHARQVFPQGKEDLAREKAALLTRGTEVLIRTPVDGMEIHLPHALAFHIKS